MKTIEEMEKALLEIGFFIGGLTDDGIRHHYNRMVAKGRIFVPVQNETI